MCTMIAVQQGCRFACARYSIINESVKRLSTVSAKKAQISYQGDLSPGMRAGMYIIPPHHFQYDVIDKRVWHDTHIYDGRQLEPGATLGRQGFELWRWPTACADFCSDAEIIRTYYAEMRKLVKKASGASQVLVFDHCVRRAPAEGNASSSFPGPVNRAHCDYTAESASELLDAICERGIHSRRLGRLMTAAELQRLVSRRFAVVNVWRSTNEKTSVQRMPLAVCDAASVAASDRVHYDVIYPIYAGAAGENYSLCFNEQQKWYYFPQMVQDECLIFLTFDNSSANTRFVFHCAIGDPDTLVDAPARESVEIRAVAFFDDDVDEEDILQCKVKMKGGKMVDRFPSHE